MARPERTAEFRTGGCLCDKIRYSLSGSPDWVVQCYCRDCQRATGTGHTTIAAYHLADQVVVEGNPRRFTTAGDTGGNVHRHFCECCGSRLFTTSDLSGPMAIFQCGTLDDPNSIQPTAAIYVKDKITWDSIDPALPQFPAMSPDIV